MPLPPFRTCFLLAALGLPLAVAAQTFDAPTLIDVPDGPGPATPYPSTVQVSGLTGNVTDVRLIIKRFAFRNPDDVGLLLVGPSGQRVHLMTDVGAIDPDELGETSPTPVSTFVFAVEGMPMPDISPSAAGIPPRVYLPTRGTSGAGDFSSPHADTWPAPAPTGASPTDLTALNGPAAAANGTWSLYVDVDTTASYGRIEEGWSITFTTVATPVAPTVSMASAVALADGTGNAPITVQTAGVATASLGLACNIAPGSAQFRIVGAATRDIAAPATTGNSVAPIDLACERQDTAQQATLRCAQSATPARADLDLLATVTCPARPIPPTAPHVAPLPATTLDAGAGNVPVTVDGAGTAGGQLTLACSIAAGSANFRITQGATRTLVAPAALGAAAPPIALACDVGAVQAQSTLVCQQTSVPAAALPDLAAPVTCPGLAVGTIGAVPVPFARDTAMIWLAVLLAALGALQLSRRAS